MESLQNTLTPSPLDYKIVIVADNCNLETEDYIQSLPKDIIKVSTRESVGPGKARNLGMLAAGEADYYYHSDCDMYFLPGWLDTLYRAYNTFPELGIVGGRKHPHHGVSDIWEKNGIKVLISDQQVGMSLFFSKEVWGKIGSFKDNGSSPHTMGQEDTAFCSMVQDLGYKVGSVDPAVVLHCGIKNTFNMDTAGYEDELKQNFPEGVKYGIYE